MSHTLWRWLTPLSLRDLSHRDKALLKYCNMYQSALENDQHFLIGNILHWEPKDICQAECSPWSRVTQDAAHFLLLWRRYSCISLVNWVLESFTVKSSKPSHIQTLVPKEFLCSASVLSNIIPWAAYGYFATKMCWTWLNLKKVFNLNEF